MNTILITGGAGFIGANLAYRLLSSGHKVCIFDNLSRDHVARNLSWLMSTVGENLHVDIGDIRDRMAVRRALKPVDHVFHLAAQVAVTSSIEDPQMDFDINAGGTFHLLEEMRSAPNHPSLIYTSTNKVYGSLEYIPLRLQGKRYVRADCGPAGIDENATLNFHSPYGCSKGAAEQYVLDYARSYGIRTAVFRMSCIYGPRQFGTEDQGWVAHIMAHALAGKPITIYGDGGQVRDILYISDLIDALLLAKNHILDISGQAFNIGGGPENSISLLELVEMLSPLNTRVSFSQWRIGDQKYYVSDTTKFRSATGWIPRVDVREGVKALQEWLIESRIAADQLVRQAS